MSAESIHYDIIIVGGGPAGLAAAIRCKQLKPDYSVCLLEKAREIGAHILSGAVIETKALDELLPDWRKLDAPIITKVTEDQFFFLTQKKSLRVPNWILPKTLLNHNNYIVSLSQVCHWLGEKALELGVDIYPGFSANKILFNEKKQVIGIATGDMGRDKNDQPKAKFSPGIEIYGKQTLFAEGCRGYLSEQLMHLLNLRAECDPQTYGLGIKEIWQTNSKQYKAGLVMHTIGWPLSSDVYGGGFIYHLENNQIAVGLVLGLDYKNTYLDPFQEMQRWKTHPLLIDLFENGKRLAYGARALNEGGFQSIPKLAFPGGVLIGCAAGFLNVAKIKGAHTAMKSGMMAAEHVISTIEEEKNIASTYPTALSKSWVFKELYAARNFRPWFKYGLWLGSLATGLEFKIFKKQCWWTLHHSYTDRSKTQTAKKSMRISYPPPDQKIIFDRNSSIYLSNIKYEENQPCNLKLNNPLAFSNSLEIYAAPEQRYCPAGVYEVINKKLHINAGNCIHCKTCDIKDPLNNIRWIPPEGGSGPNYQDM